MAPTRLITVDLKFSNMAAKVNFLPYCNAEICINFQFPGEDLNALVSLTDDNMGLWYHNGSG